MNFSLFGTYGHEFVRAGVRAIAHRAFAGWREESDLSRTEVVIRAGADLSDPVAVSWAKDLSERQHLCDLSAGMSAPPNTETSATLREVSGRWRLVTVRNRLTRDVLTTIGIDAPLLPCAALHAWRLHAATPQTPREGAIAVSAGLGEFTGALAEAVRARGLEPVFVKDTASLPSYEECVAGIVNAPASAFVLAGRGAPAILIGEDASALDELGLPVYRAAEAEPETVVAQLCSLMDNATRDRLLALEQQSFRAHCDAVRGALGQPDASAALYARLAAIRSRLAAGAAPPRERWIDIRPMLALEAEEFVSEAYARLLGRSAEPEGVRHWAAALACGTSKRHCLEAIAASDEARARNVRLMGFPESTEEFVRNISLGNAAPESVARWVELIDSGKLSRGDAARLIADSLPPVAVLTALADVRRELANHRRVIEGLLSSAP